MQQACAAGLMQSAYLLFHTAKMNQAGVYGDEET